MKLILRILLLTLTPSIIIRLLAAIDKKKKGRIASSVRESLSEIVRKNKLALAEVEFFGRRAIGLDIKNKKLAFVQYANTGMLQRCIDLENILFCLVKQARDPYTAAIKQVSIECKDDTEGKKSRIIFYDRDFDHVNRRASLIKKAAYWKNQINLLKRSRRITNNLELVL
jgi:hypothetical protein